MSAEKLTVKEFRMWLCGVEEMQADDWVPSAGQWQKIREKIDLLKDGPDAPSIDYSANAITAWVPPYPSTPISDINSLPAVPAGPSTIPNTTSIAPRAPASPVHLAGPFATDTSSRVQTPNIDSSDGQYKSSFV